MKEIYYLNQEKLPVLPTPHDSVINRIENNGEFISFYLDANIDDEDDGIRFYHPEAKSLIIRYHLYLEDDFSIYKMKRAPRYLHWLFPPCYRLLDNNMLEKLAGGERNLEYLYHHVGFTSIIIQLCSDSEVVLEVDADYVEYEWISNS